MGFDKAQRPRDTRKGSKASSPSDKLDSLRWGDITASTAASTALVPRGVVSLESTSTGAPVVYTLKQPIKGDEIAIAVASLASSSVAPFHVNAQSGGTFNGVASSENMVALSTAGAGITLLALSSAQWMTKGHRGATFSTST